MRAAYKKSPAYKCSEGKAQKLSTKSLLLLFLQLLVAQRERSTEWVRVEVHIAHSLPLYLEKAVHQTDAHR